MRKHYAVATTDNDGRSSSFGDTQNLARTAERLALYGDDIIALGRETATAVKRWYHFRRTVHELSRLNDRALHDIGLHRSEIEVTAYSLAEQSARSRPRYLSPAPRRRAR